MEFGFWACPKCKHKEDMPEVLILVIMEFGFWVMKIKTILSQSRSLNPCYNGIWFLREEEPSNLVPFKVLILVIMEFGFWAPQ